MIMRSVLKLAVIVLCCFQGTFGAAPSSSPKSIKGTLKTAASNFPSQLQTIRSKLGEIANGTMEMWENYGKCRSILAKQAAYRKERRQELPKDMPWLEVRRKLAADNGGISFEEYSFLTKEARERKKIWDIMFMCMVVKSPFPFIYVATKYPYLLPGPLARCFKETDMTSMARERSHTVMRTIIDVEKDLNSPMRSRLNKRLLDCFFQASHKIRKYPKSFGGTGASIVLKEFDTILYKDTPFSRQESSLVGVPATIVTGLQICVHGGTNFLYSSLPNVIKRGAVVSYAKHLAKGDEFLVGQKVDLKSLSTNVLRDACNERMIRSWGMNDKELRRELQSWLNLAVIQPKTRVEKTNSYFNENLARAVLMGYHAVDSIRHPASLPTFLHSVMRN